MLAPRWRLTACASVLSASHVATLADLLDRDPAESGLAGLEIDTDLRWRIVTALATAGEVDADGPATPCIVPAFGPLEGIRVVGTGVLVAQPYIGTKLAEFGAEVIHVERPGGDVFRSTAPHLTRGPRPG